MFKNFVELTLNLSLLLVVFAITGQVLAETPFTNENPGESLKFNVKVAYDGIGDPRW